MTNDLESNLSDDDRIEGLHNLINDMNKLPDINTPKKSRKKKEKPYGKKSEEDYQKEHDRIEESIRKTKECAQRLNATYPEKVKYENELISDIVARERNANPFRNPITQENIIDLKIDLGLARYNDGDYTGKFAGQTEKYDTGMFLKQIGCKFEIPTKQEMQRKLIRTEKYS